MRRGAGCPARDEGARQGHHRGHVHGLHGDHLLAAAAAPPGRCPGSTTPSRTPPRSSPAVESGMKAMMRKGKLPAKKINFVAMGGDGATADIGMRRPFRRAGARATT
ncbi:MAG: hypothetical protein MZU79_09075 [Anaerotruncus sp.]|nr:hypothetical protein [Anaerotruncus sp.]